MENNQKKFDILPPDYREQKSREQAAFQKAARGNPAMIRRAQVFRGICGDIKVKIINDPSLQEENQYVY